MKRINIIYINILCLVILPVQIFGQSNNQILNGLEYNIKIGYSSELNYVSYGHDLAYNFDTKKVKVSIFYGLLYSNKGSSFLGSSIINKKSKPYAVSFFYHYSGLVFRGKDNFNGFGVGSFLNFGYLDTDFITDTMGGFILTHVGLNIDEEKIARFDVVYFPIRIQKVFIFGKHLKFVPIVGYRFGINKDYNSKLNGVIQSQDSNEDFYLMYVNDYNNFANYDNRNTHRAKVVHLFELGLQFSLEVKENTGFMLNGSIIQGVNQKLFISIIDYSHQSNIGKSLDVRSDGSHFSLGAGVFYRFHTPKKE